VKPKSAAILFGPFLSFIKPRLMLDIRPVLHHQCQPGPDQLFIEHFIFLIDIGQRSPKPVLSRLVIFDYQSLPVAEFQREGLCHSAIFLPPFRRVHSNQANLASAALDLDHQGIAVDDGKKHALILRIGLQRKQQQG